MASEMMDGPGVFVTDCTGAAVVANKLKVGLRRQAGPMNEESSTCATGGLPAGYQSGNAEAPRGCRPF
eukprot:4303937-Amphidinium_carterae.1